MRYSQKDEQDYILRAVEGIPIGTFLDVGAYDGVSYSNTMCLVERGWNGIMVEPGLEAFQALLARHGGANNLTLVHAAVGDGKLSPFWNNPRTFSTTLDSNRERFINEGFGPKYWVPTVTIEALVLLYGGRIDVVSIDTEGSSVDIFSSYPMSAVYPKVFCVEHDGRIDECMRQGLMGGYSVMMRNEENIIFVR